MLVEFQNCVDVLTNKNIPLRLFEDGKAKRLRAVYSTSKSYYDIELLVKLGKVGIRIAYRNNPTRETNNTLLLKKLRKQGMVADSKVSSPMFPTFLSENLAEDFLKVVDCIESTPEFEDSTGNTWKVNGGLESGTWHIVDTVRSAVKRGHTSALGRDMYECLRSKVEVNRYNSEQGLTWGEHVVPIDFMTQELVRMCTQGSSEESMFDFVIRNHKVVYITQEQARVLDVDMGLRTVMPNNWKDGDSPFQRLTEAKIDFVIDN